MPDQPHRKGRRNPALLQPDGNAGPQIDLTEQHTEDMDDPRDGGATEFHLLDEGDFITVSATIPVVLEGHHKESYFGSKVTVRVREDEAAEFAAARGRSVAMGSILDQVEEAEDGLRRYEEQQAARLAAAGVTPR